MVTVTTPRTCVWEATVCINSNLAAICVSRNLPAKKKNNNKKTTYPHMNDGEVAHHQKNLGSDACVSSWSVGSSLRW